jgi:hypothetical protein
MMKSKKGVNALQTNVRIISRNPSRERLGYGNPDT